MHSDSLIILIPLLFRYHTLDIVSFRVRITRKAGGLRTSDFFLPIHSPVFVSEVAVSLIGRDLQVAAPTTFKYQEQLSLFDLKIFIHVNM